MTKTSNLKDDTRRYRDCNSNLITKILEDTGYNFREEECKEKITKIGKSVLPSMKFEINNGKVNENPSSSEKKKQIVKKYP